MEEKIKKITTRWLSLCVLRISSPEIKLKYRKLEKIKLKLVKIRSHLSFNETCIINQLLPTYTNVRLHDDAAAAEEFVQEFQSKLIERQITQQKEAIPKLEKEYEEQLQNFKNEVNAPLKYEAYLTLLERVCSRKQSEMMEIQKNKLIRMYGGDIFLKQHCDSVINLSSEVLDHELKEIFSLGMNCHLKQRYDQTKKKVEVEMLYENIKEKHRSNEVTIENEESLKSSLERFGMKTPKNFTKDLLTKEQYDKIKCFNLNKDIVTRRADKSNAFVILDKTYYEMEINQLLSDQTKFKKTHKDPTEELKRELNKHISNINSNSKTHKFNKLVGKYEPGYAYGNPKIHKRLVNPPLRPIISQIGTVTYEISKQLNSIIRKYIPRKYAVESTYEFITLLKVQQPSGKLASLDVESLFTNVPVHETIQIIIQNVYHHPEIPAPDIPPETLEALLELCTTKTPFRNINGDLYLQCEGVSMGSALGPTFAEFYMCNLENKVFESNPDLKPIMYVRYVDDCFIVVDHVNSILKLKSKFEQESVLKFTYELEKDHTLPFLDVSVNISNNIVKTSVHVKSTNLGDCINFRSICPDKYKISVIKTFLYRAYEICSEWQSFHQEIVRLKQMLTNNNFPMNIIDNTIKSFLDKLFLSDNKLIQDKKQINLFFQGQMSSAYKLEEKELTKIVYEHVKPVNNDNSINLRIYYKNKKLKHLFIRNKSTFKECSDKHHVVYQYCCNKEGCNSSTYIGYTTCTVGERFRMHTQNGSIRNHLINVHGETRIVKKQLTECVKILYSNNSVGLLRMTEAVLIKDVKPSINSQEEGCDRLLKIFKH